MGRNTIDALGLTVNFATGQLTDEAGVRTYLLPRAEAFVRARNLTYPERAPLTTHPWYPVGIGHCPGIYGSDGDCRLAYEGFPRVKHCKRKSYAEAQRYIDQIQSRNPECYGTALMGSLRRIRLRERTPQPRRGGRMHSVERKDPIQKGRRSSAEPTGDSVSHGPRAAPSATRQRSMDGKKRNGGLNIPRINHTRTGSVTWCAGLLIR